MSKRGGLFIHRESLERNEAIAHCVKAAAALADAVTADNHAVALLHAGLALMKIVKLDKDERALTLVREALSRITEEES